MRTSPVEVNMADADLILESQPPFYFDIIGRRSGHNGGLLDISMHGDQFDSKSSHVTTKPVKFHWFCFKGHPGVSLSFHNFHTLNILNEVENFVYFLVFCSNHQIFQMILSAVSDFLQTYCFDIQNPHSWNSLS